MATSSGGAGGAITVLRGEGGDGEVAAVRVAVGWAVAAKSAEARRRGQ